MKLTGGSMWNRRMAINIDLDQPRFPVPNPTWNMEYLRLNKEIIDKCLD